MQNTNANEKKRNETKDAGENLSWALGLLCVWVKEWVSSENAIVYLLLTMDFFRIVMMIINQTY